MEKKISCFASQENLLHHLYSEGVRPFPAAAVIIIRKLDNQSNNIKNETTNKSSSLFKDLDDALNKNGSDYYLTLMGLRAQNLSFTPNVYAFPGGKLDDDDLEFQSVEAISEQLEENQINSELVKSLERCARRECLEETGIAIPENLELKPLIRAITPRDFHRRFDTLFFTCFWDDFDDNLINNIKFSDEEFVKLSWVDLSNKFGDGLQILDITSQIGKFAFKSLSKLSKNKSSNIANQNNKAVQLKSSANNNLKSSEGITIISRFENGFKIV